MAFNEIPYTNVHELNLDWIILKIKEFTEYLDEIKPLIENLQTIEADITELQSNVSTINTTLSNYLSRIVTVESECSTLASDLTTAINSLTALINQESATRLADFNSLQNQIDAINTAIGDLPNLEARFKAYADALVKSLKEFLISYSDNGDHEIYLYINNLHAELNNTIRDIYERMESIASNVYNHNAYAYSSDGRIDFDLNNELIYHHLGNNLNSVEYCKLGLSAEEYAKYNITADEYLMYSRDRLHYDYVYMAIAGIRQNVSVAIDEIANYLFGTMTALQYATLDIDSDTYSSLDITALEYLSLNTDLTQGNRVVYSPNGVGIDADTYSHLTLI